MDDQERTILSGAAELFLKYGIRSITMDDVARELAVSKKTLYKYVSNKAELVDRCVRISLEQVHDVIENVMDKSTNAIDEVFAIDEAVDNMMKVKYPAIEFQLSKYYPQTWKWLMGKQREVIMSHTRKNLEKGVDQGLYRPEINIEFINYIYYGRFVSLNDESAVPAGICSNPEFMHEYLNYHLRGIVSKKGLEYLENKLKEESTQTSNKWKLET